MRLTIRLLLGLACSMPVLGVSSFACCGHGALATSAPKSSEEEVSPKIRDLIAQAKQHSNNKEYGKESQSLAEIVKQVSDDSKELKAAKERLAEIEKSGTKRLSEIQKKEGRWTDEKLENAYREVETQYSGLSAAEFAKARLEAMNQARKDREQAANMTSAHLNPNE